MSSDAFARSSRASGDAVEAEVIQVVEELTSIPDATARHYDAVVETAISPSKQLRMLGICILEAGTHIEIKGCQQRLASGQRGRWHVRRGQLETLVEEGASVLFAVYQPGRFPDLLAMVVVPATAVAELVDNLGGWLDAGEGRTDAEQYKQISWTRLIAPERVEGLNV